MLRGLWLVACVSGCIQDRLVDCGDHLCPTGTRCTPTSCTLLAPDAPFACPPIDTAPHFSLEVHQIVSQCSEYTISRDANLAVALCYQGATTTIAQGPVDGPMVPARGLETLANPQLAQPRITPEGDELFLSTYDSFANTRSLSVYRNVGGTWTFDRSVPS
jgi:hypothetical protein